MDQPMLFGLLCTRCCCGSMVLNEETGKLSCTHFTVDANGTIAFCGHSLEDAGWTRMVLQANALAHKGKETPPAFAVAPKKKVVVPEPSRRVGHLAVYAGFKYGAQSPRPAKKEVLA